MSDLAQPTGPSAGAEAGRDHGALMFGSLAFAGAAASLVFCYAQVLISLLAPLFGMAPFEMNIHLQAVFMWGFALVTVIGLVGDRRRHKSNVPLAISILAVAVIIAMGWLSRRNQSKNRSICVCNMVWLVMVRLRTSRWINSTFA